jgi:undecaprenyl-diphosphatase
MKKKAVNYIFLSIAICVVLFFAISICMGKEFYIDHLMKKLIVDGLRRDWLTEIVKVLTNLGSLPAYIVYVAITFFVVKNKRTVYSMVCNLGMSACIMLIVKNIVRRPRPDLMLIEETGFSFPSGHSLNAFVFFGFVIYMLYQFNKDKKTKKYLWLSILCGLLIVLIPLSRIYLGVHYASDCLCGMLVGYISLFTFINFVEYSKPLNYCWNIIDGVYKRIFGRKKKNGKEESK